MFELCLIHFCLEGAKQSSILLPIRVGKRIQHRSFFWMKPSSYLKYFQSNADQFAKLFCSILRFVLNCSSENNTRIRCFSWCGFKGAAPAQISGKPSGDVPGKCPLGRLSHFLLFEIAKIISIRSYLLRFDRIFAQKKSSASLLRQSACLATKGLSSKIVRWWLWALEVTLSIQATPSFPVSSSVWRSG